MFDDDLAPKGWKKSAPYSIPRDSVRVNRIANELRELHKNDEKKPKSAVQCASTQANLERQAKGIARNWDAEFPAEAKTDHPADVQRPISPDEFHVEQSLRESGRGHTVGTDPMASGTTKERKESAIHHFMVTPPAKITKENVDQIVGIQKYESVPYKPGKWEWLEIPWYKALWHWLKGGKVRHDKE